MGLFSKILTKLGIKKAETATTPTPNIATIPKPAAPAAAKPVAPVAKPAAPAPSATPAPSFSEKAEMDQAQQHMHVSQAPAAPAAPTPISAVDVVAHLEGLAKANPNKLDWKVSIVDLLKLLDLESSFEARKEMAVELGCPAELMSDSAKMNTWLHKTVLKEIAQNGGNIPKELLD